MNEKMNKEVIEEGTEIQMVEETEEKTSSKVKSWIKRNGKKIGKGILITTGLVLAYTLGRSYSKVSEDLTDEDSDVIDVEFDETETENE